MNREQKIKYLKLVKAGKIQPVKLLAPGTYRQAQNAEPIYVVVFDQPILFWSYYTNGEIIVYLTHIAEHKISYNSTKISLIPDDVEADLKARIKHELFFTLSRVDEIIVKQTTVSEIVEKQLANYESNENCNKDFFSGVYDHNGFDMLIQDTIKKRQANQY